MSEPRLSKYSESRKPSAVRVAQLKYKERQEKPAEVINVGVGNVSLPTHPAMMERMFNLGSKDSPFHDGVVQYVATAGTKECQDAFKNILSCEGFDTSRIHVQVTDGGSAGMELFVLSVGGEAGESEHPILLINPTYTNYMAFAKRLGRSTVTITRKLDEDGQFTLPTMAEIEDVIKTHQPNAMLVIPYDNPTGQLYDHETMVGLAELCVKYNMWMASDEAYRELFYDANKPPISIWGITDQIVPGIEGRRISIETASKVWNACGLRIGGYLTDNAKLHTQIVAEYTSNLCANAIGQYIFGALAHQTKEQFNDWFSQMRQHYQGQIVSVCEALKAREPKLIVSHSKASIYTVIDVRNVVKPGFDANDFVVYCASEGKEVIDGVEMTLLAAPMKGFYDIKGDDNPGKTQFRISYVESKAKMAKVPELFIKLLRHYEAQR